MNKQTSYLDRLRAKPLAYRRMFTLLVSAGVTLIVLLIWSVSVFAGFAPKKPAPVNEQDNLSAFSLIKSQFSEVFKNNSFDDSELSPPDFFESNSGFVTETPEDPAYMATSSDSTKASTSSEFLLQ